MNLVSVLMSGLRAVRVPITVGLAWSATLALWVYPVRDTPLSQNSALDSLSHLYSSLGTPVQLGLVAFAIYTLGTIALGLSRDFSQASGQRWRRTLFEKSELELRSWSAVGRFWEWLFPSLPVSAVMTGNILSATLGRHDHTLLRSLLPMSVLDAEFDLAVLRLSKESPDQFQQYDRVVAESELRRGLAPPVCLFFLTLGVLAQSVVLTPLVAAVGLVLAVYLSSQGHRKQNAAARYMVTAVGLSWTSTPALTGVRRELDEIEQRHAGHGGELGAKATAIVSIVTETLQGASLTRYISGLRHPARARALREHLSEDALTKVYGRSFADGLAGQGTAVQGRHRAP